MKRIGAGWIVALLALACGSFAVAQPATQPAPAAKSELSGLASVSGTVTSYAPFKAAKVYFRDVEKRMQYMVYTAGGKYQTMHLFGARHLNAEAWNAFVEMMLKNGADAPSSRRALRSKLTREAAR